MVFLTCSLQACLNSLLFTPLYNIGNYMLHTSQPGTRRRGRVTRLHTSKKVSPCAAPSQRWRNQEGVAPSAPRPPAGVCFVLWVGLRNVLITVFKSSFWLVSQMATFYRVETDPDFKIHTSYYSDFFLLRTRVLVNGRNTEIRSIEDGKYVRLAGP